MTDATTTVEVIERLLRERFAPTHLTIRDDSANHAGHAGAMSGGGHFKVVIVAAAFEGRTLLERHRAVNDAVGHLFGAQIHALALKTNTPAEWQRANS
jgi:BolA protein